MIKKIKSENGFISIEAIIVGSVFVYGALLAIGFYIFVITQSFVSSDVISFSKKIERNGGITESEVEEFKDYLVSKYKYISSPDDIEIFLIDENDQSLINTHEVSMQKSDIYLSRKNDEIAILKILIPSNNKVLSTALINTTADSLDFYGYSKLIYSERY